MTDVLSHLTQAMAKRWPGQQIVFLVDEILSTAMFTNLQDQNIPESVRMILILNPNSDAKHLSLPPSFQRVTLSTPYRSTIAITRLARFIAKRNGLVFPETEIGSDVEGTKPILFDVGHDEKKMVKALSQCRKHLGDNAIILYDNHFQNPTLRTMVMGYGKEAGGPWDCYMANRFYGWEADKVVAVTYGHLELITRARTVLSIILVEGSYGDNYYAKHKEHFREAADLGLVDLVPMPDEETCETRLVRQPG